MVSRPPRTGCVVLDRFHRFRSERGGWKIRTKCSAHPQLTIDMRKSAVSLDDALYRGKSQTCAQLLGDEARLENAVDGGSVHPSSRVGDGKHHVVARACER